jgi:hypothetical protein
LGAALGWAFGRVMLRVPIYFLPRGTGTLVWLALVVAISVVSCAWPAIKATRVPVRRALAVD